MINLMRAKPPSATPRRESNPAAAASARRATEPRPRGREGDRRETGHQGDAEKDEVGARTEKEDRAERGAVARGAAHDVVEREHDRRGEKQINRRPILHVPAEQIEPRRRACGRSGHDRTTPRDRADGPRRSAEPASRGGPRRIELEGAQRGVRESHDDEVEQRGGDRRAAFTSPARRGRERCHRAALRAIDGKTQSRAAREHEVCARPANEARCRIR